MFPRDVDQTMVSMFNPVIGRVQIHSSIDLALLEDDTQFRSQQNKEDA